MQNLAPIALFVYNRPWHTKQTIKSLAANKLAKESDLYIFADGAKGMNKLLFINYLFYFYKINNRIEYEY